MRVGLLVTNPTIVPEVFLNFARERNFQVQLERFTKESPGIKASEQVALMLEENYGGLEEGLMPLMNLHLQLGKVFPTSYSPVFRLRDGRMLEWQQYIIHLEAQVGKLMDKLEELTAPPETGLSQGEEEMLKDKRDPFEMEDLR